MFVAPIISTNKDIFAIYSLIISLSIFVNYADIGFIAASQKYSAEAFVKNDFKEEVKIIGFSLFILSQFLLLFTLALLFISFFPKYLIYNLNIRTHKVSSQLLFITSFFLPVHTLLHRCVTSILTIRFKEFILLRSEVFFNIIKLLSLFVFFNNQKYEIVYYHFFVNILSIISVLYTLYWIKYKLNYDFFQVFKSIKYNIEVFNKLKNLSITSFLMTISWVLFFEMDTILIAKIFSLNDVSIYAISFTILNLLRYFYNILFSPFLQRFYYESVEISSRKIIVLLKSLIRFFAPITLFLSTILFLSAKYFIIFWAGKSFFPAIKLFQIFVLSYSFFFIIQTTNYFFIAKLKTKYLILNSILVPIVYYIYVFLNLKNHGIISFAYGKFFGFLISALICIFGIKKLFNPFKDIAIGLKNYLFIWVIYIFLIPNLLDYLFPILSFQKNIFNFFLLLLLYLILMIFPFTIIHFTSIKNRILYCRLYK